MHLVDVNVWRAFVFEAHQHHPRALRWFNGLPPETSVMCRMAQSGFLRLATNPAAFGDEAVSMTKAWRLYDQVMADERVCFRAEPTNLEPRWRQRTDRKSRSPKVWSDAYLAAFADAMGAAIVSFDEGFAALGVELVVPAQLPQS